MASADAEELVSELKNVLASILDGLAFFSEGGDILELNHQTLEIFGYERNELIANNASVLIPAKVLEAYNHCAMDYFSSFEGQVTEVTAIKRSGEEFPLEISFNPLVYKGKPGYISVLRDISERKKLEQLKSEFISSVSHELRTPLTSIHGSLRLIVGGAAGELPAKAQGLVNIAANNCDRLVRLINDILDIEKMSAGMLDIDSKQQELIDVVTEAVNNNISFARRYNVSYSIVADIDPVLVSCDKDRILQVMDNLLSNAAKYTKEGDSVDISIEVIEDKVRVNVRDHGEGIPDSFKKKVFQRFTQADGSDTRKQGGTGLGLSICRSIIDLHKGRIGFDSVEGEGACFWFELPVLYHETEEDAAMGNAVALICEDDPDIARLLSLMLKEKGVSSDIAYSAAQADKLLQTNKYKILTLDIMLPDKDGLTFLSDLRKTEYGKDIAVLIVSAVAGKRSIEEGIMSLNVSDWISKPIDDEKLINSVKDVIGQTSETHTPRILHIEDDKDIQQLVSHTLSDYAEVLHCETLKGAHQALMKNKVDAVILDVGLPDGSGLDILPFLKSIDSTIPVIVFSAQAVSRNESSQIVSIMVKSRDDIESLANKVKELTV